MIQGMDQAISQPAVQSLALAEPTRHVRIRWIIYLTVASLGMWMATQTPLQVVLALQLQARSRRRTGSRSSGAGWPLPTGSAPGNTPISAGPG